MRHERPADPITVLSGDGRLRAPCAAVANLPAPPAWPLVGNALDFKRMGGLHKAIEHWVDELGPIFRMQLGPRTVVCVADAALISEILRHRPQVFARGQKLSEIINETGPVGLFTAEGEVWKRQRKLVMRAFTPEQLKGFFPILKTVTERLYRKWHADAQSTRTSDVARDLKCYAVDVATWLSLGEDINTLEHPDNTLQSDIDAWFTLIGKRLVTPVPYWRYVKLPGDREADKMLERLTTLVTTLISKTRAKLDANPELRQRPTNIIEALISARDEPDSEFTDEDVAGNVTTMLFAGEDTAANAMAWTLHLLSEHPTYWDEVVEEVDPLLPGDRTDLRGHAAVPQHRIRSRRGHAYQARGTDVGCHDEATRRPRRSAHAAGHVPHVGGSKGIDAKRCFRSGRSIRPAPLARQARRGPGRPQAEHVSLRCRAEVLPGAVPRDA